MSFFWFAICLWSYCGISVSLQEETFEVSKPGDVMIGGLFPFHKEVSSKRAYHRECSDIDVTMLLRAQVMIYAIEKINQSPMLPNVTIGYKMYDTCGDASLATRGTLRLLKQSGTPMCPLLDTEEEVKAVIGERHSEVSVVVARLLSLPMVPQISYASTSELLSSKIKFPSFLRTVPSDRQQTLAMAELIKKQKWDIVGIIGSDDEYGRYGSETLVDLFSAMGTCIAFKEILPAYFIQNETRTREKLDELIKKLQDHPVDAIVIFSKGRNVKAVLEEAIKYGVHRTWIASDSWSTSREISGLNNIRSIGRIIGFISKRNEVPGFKKYLHQLMSPKGGYTEGNFLLNYMSQNPCPEEDNRRNHSLCDTNDSGQMCQQLHCLQNYIGSDESYSIYLAVNVIAHALESLLECNHNRCNRNTTFPASELLEEIKTVDTTVDNTTHIYFDESGDPNIGQEILEWKFEDSMVSIESIGEYETSGTIKLYYDLSEDYFPGSNCSKSCKPGYELQSNNSCCKTCHPCKDTFISKGDDSECESCLEDEYASPQKDQCLKKEIVFFRENNGLAITLFVCTCLGLIFTILVVVLFAVYRNTPIVKAAGGYLCFLALMSLLACFSSVAVSLSKPTDLSCKIELPLFLLAFTLCISCILANLLQIFVGFSFRVKLAGLLKRLNKPAVVVSVCTGIQVVLCALWLIYDPPEMIMNDNETQIIFACGKGKLILEVVAFFYVFLLSIACFIFAYNGRRLPDLYKNARYVTISMLVYLVVCVLFLPFYFTTFNKYRQAIEACAFLVCAYSVFFCHFGPKCYIMVFKKDLNNENAIAEYIRNHYQNKSIVVVGS